MVIHRDVRGAQVFFAKVQGLGIGFGVDGCRASMIFLRFSLVATAPKPFKELQLGGGRKEPEALDLVVLHEQRSLII